MNYDINLSKIYLSCRRGMLELDILLINFLKHEYNNMDEALLKKFNLLLNESDKDLHNWLIKKGKLENLNLSIIVDKINKFSEE